MKNEIFEANPRLDLYHATSDGQAFYTETDAKNHAKSLEDKSVEIVYNENLLQVVEPEELDPADEEMKAFEAAEKEKAEKEEAEGGEQEAELAKTLSDFDPETTKYPEALKLFKALELVAENEKKDTIYPLLAEAKAKAQEGVNTEV